ncbi:hypothetical protein QOZ80_2BG0188300 [Eleusine coracana subsp. coracana]|nr:hypothetical protein QOZ80_2BG0188300 [Eleusine coracana subsp. coracana]
MAATACAYAYQQEARPPPSLIPAAPSRSSTPQVPEPLFHAKPASPPVHPPPSLLRPSSIFTRQPGLCTEGLGSESSGDVDLDDLVNDIVQDGQEGLPCERQQLLPDDSDDDAPARKKLNGRAFPPPISVIGAGGKPWLYLRRHRADGRLVLREVRIPSQELLQARREDGRFKLHFAPPQPEEEEEQLEDV